MKLHFNLIDRRLIDRFADPLPLSIFRSRRNSRTRGVKFLPWLGKLVVVSEFVRGVHVREIRLLARQRDLITVGLPPPVKGDEARSNAN